LRRDRFVVGAAVLSWSFSGSALLMPNIKVMVRRDGVWATSKGSRMKYHGTAPACSTAPYKISRLFCPRCEDLIIAATRSAHVSGNEIHHWWACEACGHEFRTTVRWLPPFVDSDAAGAVLPGRRESSPSWNRPPDVPRA
jgi:hypothetical protein